MKKHLRKIHIDDQEWKYVVESAGNCEIKEVRIYSPEKEMWRLSPEELNAICAYDGGVGDKWFIVKPHMVKDYIVKNLINQPDNQKP